MYFSESESSSSSCFRPGWSYDVFLSFRGEDTRKNFIDHLYTALVQAGVHTFRDDDELRRGEEISPQLLKAIQESKISIVVFSKGYASSTWCLDEVVKILEYNHAIDRIVLPIFYDVDPSDVRKQKGCFEEAFHSHEKYFKEKVNKWREALLEAGNLSGWNLQNLGNGHESKFIQRIVEDVLNKLDRKSLYVAKHLVGIDSRVENIVSLLSIDTDDVLIVGIYGMAGIGKTTIAKAAFNQLCYGFEGSCFLLDVKEISEQPNGRVQLQEQLLCDILKTNTSKISNSDRGINLIKERLCHKRVLVILDDVAQLEQLDALAGDCSWFGPRSRIIITTRDEHLLTQLVVDGKYQVRELNQDESLQLFTWHAFRDTHPIEDYVELSNGVVNYSGGLPLALEVLGSYLFKRSKPEWESAINKLQKIPNCRIQKKLRISFDMLDDDELKAIFLDIACFFVGRDKQYVAKILYGRGFNSEIGIRILIERSLVKINIQNELRMHDLLQDMGREIIRELSPKHLGERSRLWFHEDVLDMLNKQMGTEIVEGLALDVRASKAVPLSTESFRKMRYLKLLQINGAHLTGCYKHISKELIWLCWHECPLKSLPSNFHLDNLVVLDMQYSNIKELRKEIKFLNKLTILNLSYSKFAKTPNFQSLFGLETLILESCTSLVEVHQSIGNLETLVSLNLTGCCRLKNLPESICDLKCLETLNITMCSKLEKLPARLGYMESLTELLANETAIKQLPSSIGHLKKLRKLSLGACDDKQDLQSPSCLSLFSLWLSPRSSNSKVFLPASFSGLSSLRKLDLRDCGLSEGTILANFGSLLSLEKLNLTGNNFFNLPSGIDRLPKLETLIVMHCSKLLSISKLPASLKVLDACYCTSMEKLSIHPEKMSALFLQGCQKLKEIEGMTKGVKGKQKLILLDGCDNLSNDMKNSLVQALCKTKFQHISLLDGEIPDWFSHCREGSSLSFHVPAVSGGIYQALVVWVVYATNKGRFSRFAYPLVSASIKNKRNDTQYVKRSILLPLEKIPYSHFWVKQILPFIELPCAMEGGEELELCVETDDGSIIVEKCGVYLVVKEADVRDNHRTMMTYPSPCPEDRGFVESCKAGAD